MSRPRPELPVVDHPVTPEGVLAEVQARADATTPGPWEHGNRQHLAGVMPAMFGEGHCAYCRNGEPSWVGRADINGKRMLAHVHTDDTPWWDHGIYAPRPDGSLIVVNDTDEYGYMDDADAAFIAAARDDVPRLVATLNAVLALHYPVRGGHECACGHGQPGDCPDRRAVTAHLIGETT